MVESLFLHISFCAGETSSGLSASEAGGLRGEGVGAAVRSSSSLSRMNWRAEVIPGDTGMIELRGLSCDDVRRGRGLLVLVATKAGLGGGTGGDRADGLGGFREKTLDASWSLARAEREGEETDDDGEGRGEGEAERGVACLALRGFANKG